MDRATILSTPVPSKRVTAQASTTKQAKSQSSAAEGLMNCLPQAWLGYSVNILA